MHCAPQEIGNDSPKVSEPRKDSVSTIYQQHKFTYLEVKINFSPIFPPFFS